MKIYLGTDHAGYEMKESIKAMLESMDYTIYDMGALLYDENDDYPDFIHPVAQAISKNPHECTGIIFGGSGQGEAIVANRYKSVRTAVYNTENIELIVHAREHNDANILSLGARFISLDHAQVAVKLFLNTAFSGDERHVRRIKKIEV